MYKIISNSGNVDRELLSQLLTLYKKDKVTSFMLELNLTEALEYRSSSDINRNKVIIDDKTAGITKNTYGLMFYPVRFFGDDTNQSFYMLNLYIDKQMLMTLNTEIVTRIIAVAIENTRYITTEILSKLEDFYTLERDFEDYVSDLINMYKITFDLIEKDVELAEQIDDLIVNNKFTSIYEVKDIINGILKADSSIMSKIERLNLYGFVPRVLIEGLKKIYVDMNSMEVYHDNPEIVSKFKFTEKLSSLLPKSLYDDKNKTLDHDYRSPVDAQS